MGLRESATAVLGQPWPNVRLIAENPGSLRSIGTRFTRLALATAADKYPAPTGMLAAPPEGSGLKPVLGSYGPPVLGYTLNTLLGSLDFARSRYDKYGEISWAGMLGRRVVAAIGPEAAQAVLVDRDRAFSNEKGWSWIIGPFFHGGVMLMDYDEHHYHRRIMQQAFTRSRLAGYHALTTPALISGIGDWKPSERFLLYRHAKQLLLSMATEVFVGADAGRGAARSGQGAGREAKKLESAFEDAVRGGQAIVRTNVPGGTWHRGLQGRATLARYFRDNLAAKRAGNGDDLFSVLCHAVTEDGDRFTDEQIVDHMIFVLMAAHDTSTLALSMMTYLLGKHPQWQDRLRAECDELSQRIAPGGTDAITYADLPDLPVMDMVFKESLRMYAPVGQQIRETTKDTELLGHFIPAGTIVGVFPYDTMRMSPWWSNPDDFDPERFAPDRREDRTHRYSWAPFGGGAHKCIGLFFGEMTVKAAMYQMIRRFTWSVPVGYQVPLEWGTGPTPADGLPIRLRARTHTTQRPAVRYVQAGQ